MTGVCLQRKGGQTLTCLSLVKAGGFLVTNITFVAGISEEARRECEEWARKMVENWTLLTPEPPPPVEAEKVYKAMKKRLSYKGEFEEEWWEAFKRFDLPDTVQHWIQRDKLIEEAEKVGYVSEKYTLLLQWLKDGVNIGCEKETARMATVGENMESAFTHGEALTDTIQSWCDMGICAGPYTKKELEDMGFRNIKINPMQVRVKVNGKLRIILDLSAPHLDEWEEQMGLPGSVNSGIDKERFKTRMADTSEVLATLHRVGKDAEFTKIDWSSAYKHLAVRREDLELQCVEWGGKIFVELMVTFGCGSSPWYFNIASDVVKEIAAKAVQMKERDVCKCLDDAIPIQTRKSGLVGEYDTEYRRLCKCIGVRLAGKDYVGKIFDVGRVGEVLGLDYDLNTWSWGIPRAKMLRLLVEIKRIVVEKEVEPEVMERVMGKLNHYFKLVPGGKMNRSWLLRLERDAVRKGGKIEVDVVARTQAMWWVASLMASRDGVRIPDPRCFVAEASINIFTDAAGGGEKGEKEGGMGGVTWGVPAMNRMMWTQHKWPEWLLAGERNSLGVRFAEKLTTLEGLACLTQLAVGHKELGGAQVRLWCDNSGFVHAFAKGSSTCLYAATISKALFDLARGLDIRVDVAKTGRMSGPGERAADALSKGDLERAWEDIGNVREEKRRKIPKVIEEWVRDPVPDTELGKRILEELAGQKANLKWEEINIGRGELKSGARQSMEEGRKALVAMKARQIRDQHAKARKKKCGEAKVAAAKRQKHEKGE